MSRFAGKTAIVTGGAGDIGSAVCRRIVRDGGRIVVADLNGDRAKAVATELGSAASAVQFDAEDVHSVQAMIEEAVQRLGRLDVLHNNAALSTPEVFLKDSTAVDVDFAIWDRVMAVNLRGYLAGCKYAIPHMIKQGGGAIVNTASIAGMAGDVGRIAYGASKAGAYALTSYIATQYGAQGIRCNAVAPGLVLTNSVKQTTPEMVGLLQRHILTKEFGGPDDIANLVCFLASDEARYITGQVYVIDGGTLAHNPAVPDLAAFLAKA